MPIIRKKLSELGPGRFDRERIRSATEEQIQAWKESEGYGDFEFGSNSYPVPSVNVREIRERIGLTQQEFAKRYWLPLRTVQEWEQQRKQPSDAARILLYAISKDHKAIARVLRK